MKSKKIYRYTVRYSQEDIDRHGSLKNLRRAIIDARDGDSKKDKTSGYVTHKIKPF